MLVACLAVVLTAHSGVQDLTKAALEASGAAHARRWYLQGDILTHGIQQKVSLYFDGTSFNQRVEGPIPSIISFDGKDCYSTGISEISHKVILGVRDNALTVAWVISGQWANPNTKITVTNTNKPRTLKIVPKGGALTATLELGQDSLPKTLTYWTSNGDETWGFAAYKTFGTHPFPTKISHHYGSETEEIQIQKADDMNRGGWYDTYVHVNPYKAAYGDLSKPVEIKRIFNELFVHPLVDGKDVGWFFFDTGADVMCLDPTVAKQLNLKAIGHESAAGVVGTLQTNIYRGTTFQLGGVAYQNPAFFDIDLSDISKAFGIKVAGILGYDFISQAIFDIRANQGQMFIHKPEEDLKLDWRHIDFNEDTPCMKGYYEGGHVGYFNIDTGSNSALDITTPAVKKYDLLKDRGTKNQSTGGAGGSAQSKSGTLAWFEIAGHRFENVKTGFQITTKGVYASPYIDGNVGSGLLGKFNLILDYPHERIALLPATKK